MESKDNVAVLNYRDWIITHKAWCALNQNGWLHGNVI